MYMPGHFAYRTKRYTLTLVEACPTSRRVSRAWRAADAFSQRPWIALQFAVLDGATYVAVGNPGQRPPARSMWTLIASIG